MMLFSELRDLIRAESINGDFTRSCDVIQDVVFSLNKQTLIPIITEIGAIPEDIGHDSSEEKLYAKVADIVLAKCFQELGLLSTVNKERANCADVVAKSQVHGYTLVGDAKAFRLSRTAKNQKDFKVKSMSDWRGDNDYAVLVCPYYQYPKSNSQIYGQALDGNITLFSWEYLSVLLENDIVESLELNLSALWNISAVISGTTAVLDKNDAFLDKQSDLIRSHLHLSEEVFNAKFADFRSNIISRGELEISYWKRQIELIKNYTREQAIRELLTSMKLNEKIASIKKFIDSLRG
jgi:type II restriction enzyme